MKKMSHSHRLRTGRHSITGQIYLLSTVTRGRAPVLADFDCARAVVRTLRSCDEAGWCRTLTFVVMPDHLHWLLELRTASLSPLMQRFKSLSARAVNRCRTTSAETTTGALWQPGFHDRALRREDDLVKLARYVVANPLRAKLVKQLGDYPHWDAIWLEDPRQTGQHRAATEPLWESAPP